MNLFVKVLTASLIIVLCFGLAAKVSSAPADAVPLKALIVDGQDNHDWKRSSQVFKQILEQTGLFKVDIATSPPHGGDMGNFKPNFAAYDVVVINYNGDSWPEQTKKAFVEYVKSGGGVIIQHSADNAFPNWKEYNEIIGLGGWEDRDEKDGPYLYWKDGEIVRDMSPGSGGTHGAERAYQIVNRNTEHPITIGLPEKWMHAKDELYAKLRGPAKNLTILSTGHSNVSGREELLLFTINYGEGRVFHTVLGHNPYGGGPWPPVECVGFIVTFQRGTEWAATGKVTQKVPEDFPTATEVHRRKGYKSPSLDELLEKVSTYQYGDSRKAFFKLNDYVRNIIGFEDERKLYESRFIDVLKSEAALPGKQYICRKLRLIGTAASVPVLRGMLTDEDTSDMARYALERIPGEEADKALRKVLSESEGKIKVGVINTLGRRRDAKSVRTLAGLIYDSDEVTASAAVNALRQIADDEAVKTLQKATEKTTGSLRKLVLDASLDCAGKLAEEGETDKARGIYKDLFVSDMPLMIRIGALRGIVGSSPESSAGFVTKVLETERPRMQAAAIQLVGQSSAVGNLPEIAAKLPALATRQQIQLLAALEQRGDAAVLDDVLKAAKSDETTVQVAALKTLGSLQDGTVVMLLARSAAEDYKLRDAARESLYRLSAPNFKQIILANIPKAKPPVKIELIRAVAQRNITGAVDAILKTAKAPEPAVRIESFKTLKTIADSRQIPEVLDLIMNSRSPSEMKLAEEVLVLVSKAAPKEAAGKVLSVLKSVKDVEVKCSLLRVLGGIGDETAFDTLKAALKDKNEDIKKAAIRALSDWPDDSPAEELFNIAAGEENKAYKTLALRGFVRLIGLSNERDDKETMQLYKKAMSVASELGEQKRILSGLANVKTIQSLRFAEDYLDNEQLAAAAAAVIVRVAPETFEKYPGETRRLLRKVIKVSKREYLTERAREMLKEVEE